MVAPLCCFPCMIMLACLVQDCNLVAYSALAQTYGENAATAVYESTTYYDAANAPCNLFISRANGGSIYIEDATGAVIFQEPSHPPLYTFQRIKFSTCGYFGRLGPTLSACTASYAQSGAWTGNTAFFDVLNGIQAWTVPSTAKYRYLLWYCLQLQCFNCVAMQCGEIRSCLQLHSCWSQRRGTWWVGRAGLWQCHSGSRVDRLSRGGPAPTDSQHHRLIRRRRRYLCLPWQP